MTQRTSYWNWRTTLCLYIPGFQRQVFEHVPTCEWIPLTNTSNVGFVVALVLLWILQGANIGRCSGFLKCKRIPQMWVDSANVCGLRLQFAHSTYNLRIPRQLRVPRKLKFTKPTYYFLFIDSTNCSGFRKFFFSLRKFCCGFRKVACFWSNFQQPSVSAICPWNAK